MYTTKVMVSGLQHLDNIISVASRNIIDHDEEWRGCALDVNHRPQTTIHNQIHTSQGEESAVKSYFRTYLYILCLVFPIV